MRSQCDIKATPKRVDSQLIGTPMRPQSHLKATLRLPQSHTEGNAEFRMKNAGALGEDVRNRGWKSPRSRGQASGVQNESDEWKSLTNSPRPRGACRKEHRWTFGTDRKSTRLNSSHLGI